MSTSLAFPLSAQGIETAAAIYPNLSTSNLVEQAIISGEGAVAAWGTCC